MSSVNDKQVGGDHYRSEVQHWDFVECNGLRYLEGCATKYATRNRKKHEDPTTDLEKASHYVEKVIALYEAGVLKPRTAPIQIGVHQFAQANGLNDDEKSFVNLLTYWQNADELRTALFILRRMIAKVVI